MATTNNAIQQVVNAAAIKLAEQQYRLARYFTPYNFEPEKIDYDRVEAFLDDPHRAFPEASDKLAAGLTMIGTIAAEQRAILQAFAAQDVAPTLTEDQLFTTGSANVRDPRGARSAA